MSVTLTCASTTTPAGSSITLDVTIASTLPLACTSVQFTLTYAASLTLTGVTNGAVSIAASKTLNRTGNLCIIAGFNTNVIADGVLVTLAFNVSATPLSTSVSVGFTGIVASDAAADPITASGVSGLVTITSVTPPIPPPSMCEDVPVNAYTPPLLLLNEPVEQVGT